MVKTTLRILAIPLGLAFISLGLWFVFEPKDYNWLDKFNIATFLIMGAIYVFYGITGRTLRSLKKTVFREEGAVRDENA